MSQQPSPKELLDREGLQLPVRDFQRFSKFVRNGWEMFSCGPPRKSSAGQEFLDLCVHASESFILEPESSLQSHFVALDGLKQILLFCCERALPPKGDGRLTCELDKPVLAWIRLNVSKLLSICNNILSTLLPRRSDTGDFSERWRSVEHMIKETAGPVLYLVCVYSSPDYAWSNKTSSRIAGELGKTLCSCCNTASLTSLLNGVEDPKLQSPRRSSLGPVLPAVLKLLQERLTREQWRCYPAAIEVLSWCLLHTKQDLLEENVSVFMVPLLILVDEGEASVQLSLCGIRGLTHLVASSTAAELCRSNRVHVLCDALTRHMYCRNPVLLEPLIPLLLKVSMIAQQSEQLGSASSCNAPFVQWGQLDDIFEHLLSSGHSESRLVLRRVYLNGVLEALPRMGGKLFLHMRLLMEVLIAYLEVPDPPDETARFTALAIFRQLIASAWPCVSAARNSQRLLQTSLKLLASATVHSSDFISADDVSTLSTPEAAQCIKTSSDADQIDAYARRVSVIARRDLGVNVAVVSFLCAAVLDCIGALSRCSEHIMSCMASLKKGLPHHGVLQCLELVCQNYSYSNTKVNEKAKV